MTLTPVINLTDQHKQLLKTDGHLLVLGGPGSGKTTIALLKANHILEKKTLLPRQKLLFLSFARATVSRIVEHSRKVIATNHGGTLEINTYHGFAWNVIRSHGYLLATSHKIRLLPPPEAAALLSRLSPEHRDAEKRRLFEMEGLLHFDLFASVCAELLSGSQRLKAIIADAYPVIVVDEFQDTNADEWGIIKRLGESSTIVALADAEQRIYEFRGADPARIGEFVETFRPTSFDFENDNHRSGGTDIALFGNDLLTGKNKGKTYKNVEIFRYPLYRSVDICYALKTAVLKGMRRLDSNKTENWSIAVLVPTKRLMLAVSNYLSAAENKLPALVHDVALDQEGLALSASAIAALLEGGKTKLEISHKLIESLCMHIRGRRGGNDTTPQMELELADALDSYRSSGVVRGKKRQEIVAESLNIAEQRLNISLSGNPGDDWLQMRSFLEQSNSEFIQNLGTNARYLRLLNKGTVLRQRLNESWRANGFYRGALEIVKDALVQEHFSSSTRMWSGINVMTIHKAKGKEFDEVFIFDGYKQGKIVRSKCNAKELAQARLALRVGVTRAMKRTTILSPQIDCCPLL